MKGWVDAKRFFDGPRARQTQRVYGGDGRSTMKAMGQFHRLHFFFFGEYPIFFPRQGIRGRLKKGSGGVLMLVEAESKRCHKSIQTLGGKMIVETRVKVLHGHK